ncbi:MAG: N-acetylmuramoyl-L-alanine amidase [Firmicutes bacterium]|nr:N-acetylmuramoyl-L-alanine amidase [Bacillota bacterium]
MQGRGMIGFQRRRSWWVAALFLTLVLSVVSTPQHRSYERVLAQARTLAPQIIVLDPGHGGIDTGAEGPGGVMEKDITLPVCQYLKEYFRLSGARVLLTRHDDRELSDDLVEDLRERVRLGNEARATVFLSIHGNSFPSPYEYGAQAFYYPNHPESPRLAHCIQDELVSMTTPLGENYREVQEADFHVLRNSKCPAALIEIGFLSNPEEEALLADPAYQKRLAWHIFAGTVAFLRGEGQEVPAP